MKHELTGGLISNAVLSALSFAVKEGQGDEKPLLTEKLLSWGAKQQLKGLLEMVDFERRVIPTTGLQDLIIEPSILQQVQLILTSGKTHKFVSAQWGFGLHGNLACSTGISCLICGSPGVGKTALAHAIAFELGQPIKVSCLKQILCFFFFLFLLCGIFALPDDFFVSCYHCEFLINTSIKEKMWGVFTT